MAQYPNSVPGFSTKQNVTTVVDASHPNSVQSEVTAIGLELGINPRLSTRGGVTYADVKARLDGMETDYRLLTNHDSHAALGGLAGDDHTQYLRADGTRALTGTAAMVAAPGPVQAGDTQATGAANAFARSDHRHAVSTAPPAASAVGDAQVEGTATTFARSDHKHAREAFGAVVAASAFGGGSANGTATTVARSDHVHGTPALGGTPVTQVVGDAAVAGSSGTASPSDHRHGMPGFAAVTAEISFGIAAANGTAATLARSDHTHGTPSLGTTVTDERTWGIAPAAGSATTASKSDHTHGSPDPTLMGPTGTICMFPNATPPTGWLLCDGASYLRATYPTLFTALGGAASPWGLPDGTHFNVPDIRGTVVVGSMGAGPGLTSRALAARGGAEAVTLTLSQVPGHSHTVNSHNHAGGTQYTDPSHAHSISYEYVTTSFMAANWSHTHGYDRPGMLNIGLSPGSNQYALNRLGDNTGATNIDHQHSADHAHSAGSTSINHNHGMNAESPGTDAQGGGASHSIMQPWVAMPFIIKT